MAELLVIEHIKDLDAHCALAFTFFQVLVVSVDEVDGCVDAPADIALIYRDVCIIALIE